MGKRISLCVVAAVAAIFSGGTSADVADGAAATHAITQPVLEKTCKLRIPFIENQGQIQDQEIRYYADVLGGTVAVTRQGELLYALPLLEQGPPAGHDGEPRLKSSGGWVLKERVVGAQVCDPQGSERASTSVSWYVGSDPGSWRKEIPTYSHVSLGEVSDGVDLVVRAYGRTVEKVFTLGPGAAADSIALKLEGALGLEVNGQGELEVATGLGKARFTRPVAYQERDGKKEYVPAAYRVLDKDTYGFTVAAYDASRPLVIDPLLASTFLGGAGNEWAMALTLDGAGNVYVAGATTSANFPTTPGAYDTSYFSQEDVFVTKLNADLTQILASTYIGGSGSFDIYGNDEGKALAIDGDGNVYVAGSTASPNFPATAGAYDSSWNGDFDTFVCVFDADLANLLASTFLGGGESETNPRLDIGDQGDVYVAGHTYSSNFPTTDQAFDTSFSGSSDVYVARLDAALTSLVASTLLGGSGMENLGAMTLDASGNVYVAGRSYGGADFPVTEGAYNMSYVGGTSFVSRLAPDLTVLLASTFVGMGSPSSMAVNDAGDVYLAGDTWSDLEPTYPTTPGAYDTSVNGWQEAFVSRLDAGLSSLLASTFLGGEGNDAAVSISLGTQDDVYVAGSTASPDFPATPGAFDASLSGGQDAFISMFDADLSTLFASSFLGGASDDYGKSLVTDGLGNLYVSGDTFSMDFPATADAYDTGFNGVKDGFVAKLNGFSAGQLRETFSSSSNAEETLASRAVSIADAALTGALTGTISFTDLEMVSIRTGPFAGKGFSTGTWEASIDGSPFSGTWRGMFFPNEADETVELKGTVSGDISAVVEGSLSESTAGSGLFDRFRASWRLHEVAGQKVSGTVELTGTAGHAAQVEYPSTGLRLLQTSLEAEGVAYYTNRLGVTFTQVLIDDESSPYQGQGFSILSYVADPGPGLGWTWDEATSPGRVEMKGLLTGSLLGIAAITMDETGPQRKLVVRLERLDLGAGTAPMPDLEVATWGPDRVSPGLTIDYIDYMVSYCNRGAIAAQGAFVVDRLPVEVAYLTSTGGGVYLPDSHEVVWNVGTLAPGEQGLVSVTGVMTRGLIQNVQFDNQTLIGCANPEIDTVLSPEMTALTPWWNEAMMLYADPVIPWAPPSNDTDYDVRDDYYLDQNVQDAIDLVEQVSPNEALELLELREQGRLNVDTTPESQGLWNGQFVLNELGLCEMYLGGGTGYDIVGTNVGNALEVHNSSYNDLDGYCFRDIPPSMQGSLGTPEENQLFLASVMVHENKHRKQVAGEFWGGRQAGEIEAHQAQADFLIAYALKRAEEGEYDSALMSLDLADDTWGALAERSASASWTVGADAAETGLEYTATIRALIEERRLVEAEAEMHEVEEMMKRYLRTLPADKVRNLSCHGLFVALAHDPNAKYGPEGSISAGQTLSYRVEFENEGEGIAYGVYFTDILDSDLDDSTLSLGPVLDVATGVEIAPPGIYDPQTRTVTWFVGTVGPHMGGYADFTVNVRGDAPDGTEVVNYGTVYFPSVPEETRTNGIVSIVGVEFPPVAAAGGPYEGAVGLPILFDAGGSTDEGTTGGISLYEWDWDGDGIFDETTSSPAVEHLWVTPYSGTVILRIIDRGGLTATDTTSVEVVPMVPVARAGGPYSGTVGLPVVLDASGSEDPDGSIVRYEWDWNGDGTSDETTFDPVIEHTWVNEYTGLVRLKVVDNDGLTGFGAAYAELVARLPVAEAGGPYAGVIGSPVLFDASGSHDPDGEIVRYEWDWDGDGVFDDQSASPAAQHTWNAEFTGTVTLRVWDDEDQTGTDTAAVDVGFGEPVAEAGGPYQGVAGLPILFDAGGSHDIDGEIVWYEWDWDNDGNYDDAGSSPSIEHTWDNEFSGTVTLRVRDDRDLTGIDTASVFVASGQLVAEAGGPYLGVAALPILFDASASYDPNGQIVWYEWDWDDDGYPDDAGSSPVIEHTWDDAFVGTVTLQVWDDDGNAAIDTASVDVNYGEPVAEAGGPYFGSPGAPVIFDASASHDRNGQIQWYEWDWDNDGYYDDGSEVPFMEHTWDTEFVGAVTLQVWDDEGLNGVDTAEVHVELCAPTGVPESECNGADDDCDGGADEDFVPTPTFCGQGVCAATGQSTCQAGALVDTCEPGEPQAEGPYGAPTCSDGLDNDCDGAADADDSNCEYACTPTGIPETECNGADDDCDGDADEDFVPEPTSCGQGVCASTGQNTCQGGALVDTCEPGEPQAEGPYGAPNCTDGQDNDCDGAADSDDSSCEYVCTPSGIAESVCNGADDDCDDDVDEDFIPTPTSCGQGVCAATGQSTCQAGALVDTCEPGDPTGADDDCNGVDENCNGAADENFTPTPTSCGVGECSSTGVLSCENGLPLNDCMPGIPAEEVCDGRDNNCDGQTDEGVLSTYYLDLDGDGYGDPDPGLTVEACAPPPAYVENATDCNDSEALVNPGAAETCNGIDDNCDAEVDEGFDEDGDGYTSCQGDCADDDPATHPGTAESCDDGEDNDCDGLVDAQDPDCAAARPDLKGSWSKLLYLKIRTPRGWFVLATLKVANIGDADAGAFKIRYYYSPQGSSDRQYLDRTGISRLAKGRTTLDLRIYWFRSDPKDGSLVAVTDADQTVQESNENNNEAKKKIR
ncbi:MAG: PKD domain-containing protein [bacterium]